MNQDSNQASSRGQWGSRVGFILAAAGSAIGLGNIWKFPYITGEYGGGAFVLVYIGCVIIVGLPLMISELIIGRHSRLNTVGAFKAMHHPGSWWQSVGWLGIASGFIILSFYSVIAGWALSYIFKSIAGFAGTAEQIQDQFGALAGNAPISILWNTIFMALNVAIVMGGVKGGIERWSKILMPSLFLILLGLVFYGMFGTHGGSQALAFLFEPNFHELSAEAVLSALGHAFFTLSLGMGAMITYGSYMKRNESLLRDAIAISFLDTLIALMAGFAIFSLVFTYGMEPAQGPGLVFKTLPVLFANTGPWVSVPFFILLSFAALTSAISLLEVVVAYFVDERGWHRKGTTIVVGIIIWLVGNYSAIACLNFPFRGKEQGVLDIFDFISTNYMLPIGGLLTCIFIAWVVKPQDKMKEFGSDGLLYKGLNFTLRFITPVAVLLVILHGLELLPFMDYN
jgi:NSS family neurotransmitter:Na+ symporter